MATGSDLRSSERLEGVAEFVLGDSWRDGVPRAAGRVAGVSTHEIRALALSLTVSNAERSGRKKLYGSLTFRVSRPDTLLLFAVALRPP